MPHAQINGFSMYYERHGDAGEPIVLVHGYTGDVGDWPDQIAEFSKTHRVLAMDHRGHGSSEGPADRASYTITQMADDVEALVEHAGFGRYHLVGHSMGGAVAQEIALRSAQRLITLTLFGTGADFRLNRSTTVTKWMEARNSLAEERGMEAVVASSPPFPDPPHMPPGRHEYERARMLRMPVAGLGGGWHALTTWPGAADRVRQITTPALIMSGELDRAVKGATYLAGQIAGATLLIIPEAGHNPQWERPEIFNAALREHISRQAAASASG